jgi:hypothetical protein
MFIYKRVSVSDGAYIQALICICYDGAATGLIDTGAVLYPSRIYLFSRDF